jgi:hypothetical protein
MPWIQCIQCINSAIEHAAACSKKLMLHHLCLQLQVQQFAKAVQALREESLTAASVAQPDKPAGQPARKGSGVQQQTHAMLMAHGALRAHAS